MPVSVMVCGFFFLTPLATPRSSKSTLSVNSASFRPQKGEREREKKDRKSPRVPPSDRGVSVTGKVDIGRRSDASATRFYFLSLRGRNVVLLGIPAARTGGGRTRWSGTSSADDEHSPTFKHYPLYWSVSSELITYAINCSSTKGRLSNPAPPAPPKRSRRLLLPPPPPPLRTRQTKRRPTGKQSSEEADFF